MIINPRFPGEPKRKPAVHTFILARNGSDARREQDRIKEQRHNVLGPDILGRFDHYFHIVTEPNRMRGRVISPDEVVLTPQFWDNPTAQEILDELRVCVSFSADIL